MLAKSKVIGIILSCIFCISAVTCGIVFGVLKSQPQTTATTESATLATNLFNTNGTINANAATALLNAVGYYDYSATTTAYTAHNIAGRTSNNSGKSIIFKMGYANGTSGTDLVWQATYLYNNYLTIWLDKNYTTSTWNSSSVAVSYNSYANSTIQAYLDDTLYGTITQSSSTLKSIFATPREVGYQTIKSGTTNDTSYKYNNYTSTFDNMSSGVADSYLWLPSFYEVCNTSTTSTYTNSTTAYTGQWGLNSTDRAFATSCYTGSDTASNCWLRSGYSNYSVGAVVVEGSGSYNYINVYASHGVRSAAHLSLSGIASLVKYEVTFNSNGGSNCSSISVEYGDTYGTLPKPTKTGYTFAGWYKNSDFSGSPVTANDIVTSDHTLYAKWENIKFNITGSSTELSDSDIFLIDDKYIKAYVTPQSGHYISQISFDNVTFYPIEYYEASIYDLPFALNVKYTASTTNNLIQLDFVGIYQSYLDNIGAINVCLVTTTTPYSDLKTRGGTSISGVALQVQNVSTTNTLACVGEARINGYTTTDGLTSVHVSAVASSGFRFVGWTTNEDDDLSSYNASADIPYNLIEGKILIAQFDNTNLSVNDSLNN